MDTGTARQRRDRALLSSGRALTLLERGADGVAVIAAMDQAHAAVAELTSTPHDLPPLADLLDQLLLEIDHARLGRITGSPRLDAALHRVRTAWFNGPLRASPGRQPDAPPRRDRARRPRGIPGSDMGQK